MMPAFIMISPASTKNGIDIRGNAFTAFIILDGSTLRPKPETRMPLTAATPSEKASGMPRMAARKKTPIMVSVMRRLPVPPGRRRHRAGG